MRRLGLFGRDELRKINMIGIHKHEKIEVPINVFFRFMLKG